MGGACCCCCKAKRRCFSSALNALCRATCWQTSLLANWRTTPGTCSKFLRILKALTCKSCSDCSEQFTGFFEIYISLLLVLEMTLIEVAGLSINSGMALIEQ